MPSKKGSSIDSLSQSSNQSKADSFQSHDLPQIAGITNLKAGAKGRNFESFTGMMDPSYIKNRPASISDDDSPVKVLIKLYKQQ